MRGRTLLGAFAALSVACGTLAATQGPHEVSAEPSSVSSPIPTPPPTPVPPFGSPSPYPTALATPTDRAAPPSLDAASFVLTDMETGQVLYARRPRKRLPVASLTKIMTSLVVMTRADLDEVARASSLAASETGSELGLRAGERMSVRLLLRALLLQSSNDAAVALAEHVGGRVARFVRIMNRTARKLGLAQTRFASPHGLDDRGRSSALDLARLTRRAYRLPEFGRIVRTKSFDIPSPTGPPRHIQNRNALLWLYPSAIGVKTGYTSAAGYCLVAAARRAGRSVLTVVLGNEAPAFDDAASLLNFGFAGFESRAVVREGERLGRVRVEGRSIVAVAARPLHRLFRRGSSPRILKRLVPLPSLRLPVDEGSRIARTRVTVGGRVVGSVGAVAARSAYPPDVAPPPLTPSSLEQLRRVAQVLAAFLQATFGFAPVVAP